jgi:hypothetical protein
MRLRILIGLAALVAVALPAQAGAGVFGGVVVAKHVREGTLVLAGARGVGVTVRGEAARARLGDRVRVQGTRLRDGTVRGSALRVLSHTRSATIHGVVVRQLARASLVATGRSVITIHYPSARLVASAADHGRLAPGSVAQFQVQVGTQLVETAPVVPLGQVASVSIEGAVVSVSPFVVSIEGLPVTITVPAGTTLPALAVGDRIELTVSVGAGNVFTLVAIDQSVNQDEDSGGDDGGGDD